MREPVPAPEPVIDQQALPPTQYLVLEILAARLRLGHACWTLPTRLRPALRALEDVGLVAFKAGVVPSTLLAWLTETGRAVCLDAAYQRPVPGDVWTDAGMLPPDEAPRATTEATWDDAVQAVAASTAVPVDTAVHSPEVPCPGCTRLAHGFMAALEQAGFTVHGPGAHDTAP